MADIQSTSSTFAWTDKEIELLLESIKSYKVECESDGIDWESVKTKYEKITVTFHENYPKNENEDFPHAKNIGILNKARVNSKTKNIRANYKKAIDAGRRSGGGRVIMTFFEICNEIWAGSPATSSIVGGVDTSTVNVTEETHTEGDSQVVPDNQDRRNKISSFLKDERNKRMSRKRSFEQQQLSFQQEELI